MGKRGEKRGRPATGQAPALSLRLPDGWIKQIDRIAYESGGSRSKVARVLIGSALASRKVKNGAGTEVSQLNLETARAFIELWHYSGSVPAGRNIFFGWFVEGELYAVACYGIGVNMGQEKYLARITGLPVRRNNLLELKRLCRVEPARQNCPLSKFIAACHRMLRRDHGIRFVVSFSDPTHNRFKQRRKGVPYESGGIYKASNFQYLGKTSAEWHVKDTRGRKLHRRLAYRYMFRVNGADRKKWKRSAITLAKAREHLGLQRQRTRGKDRWFIDLT